MTALDWLGAPQLGVYCERGVDAGFWAEPFNALTNAAFLLAAIAILARSDDRAVRALAWITAAIGVGSFLFHTFATRAALLADVIPIRMFMGVYFYFALRRLVGIGAIPALLGTIGFLAAASALPAVAPEDEPWRGLSGYLGGMLGLVGVGTVLATRGGASAVAGRGLFAAAGLFALSLTFRTIDGAVCSSVPLGVHGLWHVLNALVLFTLMTVLGRAPR